MIDLINDINKVYLNIALIFVKYISEILFSFRSFIIFMPVSLNQLNSDDRDSN